MVIVYLSDKSDDDETPKRSPDTKKNDEEDENKKCIPTFYKFLMIKKTVQKSG